ncbi:transposase, partial [Brucella melitensis]
MPRMDYSSGLDLLRHKGFLSTHENLSSFPNQVHLDMHILQHKIFWHLSAAMIQGFEIGEPLMTRRRYELTDHEWSIISPLLPNKPRGVARVDDRRVLNGILWRFRTGSPWAEV